MDNCGTKRNEALKIILAAIYFLQINSSSNWRWRSEADSAEEFADDSQCLFVFQISYKGLIYDRILKDNEIVFVT